MSFTRRPTLGERRVTCRGKKRKKYLKKEYGKKYRVASMIGTGSDIKRPTLTEQGRISKEEVRKRFIDFMINFLLCTQVAIVFAICFIIIKIY